MSGLQFRSTSVWCVVCYVRWWTSQCHHKTTARSTYVGSLIMNRIISMFRRRHMHQIWLKCTTIGTPTIFRGKGCYKLMQEKKVSQIALDLSYNQGAGACPVQGPVGGHPAAPLVRIDPNPLHWGSSFFSFFCVSTGLRTELQAKIEGWMWVVSRKPRSDCGNSGVSLLTRVFCFSWKGPEDREFMSSKRKQNLWSRLLLLGRSGKKRLLL